MSDTYGQPAEGKQTREEAENKPGGASAFWLAQIELAEKEHAGWMETAGKVVKRYRSEEKTNNNRSHFNILYSNVETWKAALFQQTPEPDVRRRNMDRDPVARFVSEMIERALRYVIDREDLENEVEAAVQEYKLTGRSVPWVNYEPRFEKVTETIDKIETDPETGVTSIGQEKIEREVIAGQRVWIESTHYKDIVLPAARKHTKLPWAGRKRYMTRDELVRQFGKEIGYKVPLTWTPEAMKDREVNEFFQRAEVIEIWDSEKREVVYVAKGHDGVLAKDEDPLGLEHFFPFPPPLLDIKTSDTIVPVCEYEQYLPLAEELDEIQQRIRTLTKALKRRGIYPESIEAMSRLENLSDNKFAPVPEDVFRQIMEAGGLEKLLQTEGIKGIAEVVLSLYQQREQLKNAIYEVIGISDAMRGSGQATEKATMTKVKASFGSMRLQKKQREVARHIRDGLRIIAEIIAEHFELPILIEMTGMQEELMQLAQQTGQDPRPEILRLLREDRLRSYRIDIETDSTIAADAAEERQAFTQLMQGTAQFAQSMRGIPEEVQPFMLRMFASAFRRFKIGRTLEDDLEEAIERLSQPKQPQPSPEMLKIQQDGKFRAAKLQQDGQHKAAELQQKGQIALIEANQNAQTELAVAQIEAQADIAKEQMTVPQFFPEMEPME